MGNGNNYTNAELADMYEIFMDKTVDKSNGKKDSPLYIKCLFTQFNGGDEFSIVDYCGANDGKFNYEKYAAGDETFKDISGFRPKMRKLIGWAIKEGKHPELTKGQLVDKIIGDHTTYMKSNQLHGRNVGGRSRPIGKAYTSDGYHLDAMHEGDCQD